MASDAAASQIILGRYIDYGAQSNMGISQLSKTKKTILIDKENDSMMSGSEDISNSRSRSRQPKKQSKNAERSPFLDYSDLGGASVSRGESTFQNRVSKSNLALKQKMLHKHSGNDSFESIGSKFKMSKENSLSRGRKNEANPPLRKASTKKERHSKILTDFDDMVQMNMSAEIKKSRSRDRNDHHTQ